MADDADIPKIRVEAVFRFHLGTIGVLLLAQLLLHSALYVVDYSDFDKIRRLFDLNDEHSVPNLLSAFALAICGLTAMVIARRSSEDRAMMAARGWTSCSIILLFLAIDEGAGLHDAISGKVAGMIAGTSPLGILYSAWVIPYAVAVILVLCLMSRFVLMLPAATRNRLAVASILYVGAAIGMELPEGFMAEQAAAAGMTATAIDSMPMMILMHTIEEIGELLAVALVLRALLLHLSVHTRLPGIIITSDAVSPAPSTPGNPHRPVPASA